MQWDGDIMMVGLENRSPEWNRIKQIQSSDCLGASFMQGVYCDDDGGDGDGDGDGQRRSVPLRPLLSLLVIALLDS
jgi:hypothetical protein